MKSYVPYSKSGRKDIANENDDDSRANDCGTLAMTVYTVNNIGKLFNAAAREVGIKVR